MSRSARLGLVGLTLFFALFPLTLDKPGLPAGLKADEPAYYLMALSLAHDGDLRLEVGDVDRLFAEFPFRPVRNLIVMSDDGWRTVHFGKPFVYPLLAAPFARAFGANGLVCFNLLLLMGMVWMGFVYLRRFNPEGLAALFSAAFFLLSLGFAYAFWMQPEVLNMASVAAALFFGFHRFAAAGESAERVAARWWPALLSGACLVPAVYNKPMIALVGLPLLLPELAGRRWRRAAAWLAGAALAMGLVTALATALTGHPTPYLGVVRQGVTLCQPGELPVAARPEAAGAAAPSAERPTGGAWSWIFQGPTIVPAELAENVGYFLWGRHTGLLLYMPFAVLAIVYFLLVGRRSGRRWLLLASLAAVAGVFLVFVSHNWQGGGGFVGNRYYVNLYPGFLFLVTALRPRWPATAGFVLSGLFLGPILFSPFGRGEPEPTLQAHVRHGPFRLFPLELSLREVPGYEKRWVGDRALIGRKDVFLPRGEEIWLRGGSAVEVWMLGAEPLDEAVFAIRNVTPGNRIHLSLGDAEETLVFGDAPPGGEVRQVTLRPGGPDKVVSRHGEKVWVDRLVVSAAAGRIRPWTRWLPPEPCPYFPANESYEESFLLGAGLLYLGRGEALAADVYGVRWGVIETPGRVRAGETFPVPVRLFNRSGAAWEGTGAARVRLSYHWRRLHGEVVEWNGRRTDLPLPVPPGGRVAVRQGIEAPTEPGIYLLELDLLLEHVAWFSERGGEVFRVPVEVLPAGPDEAGSDPATGTAGER